MADKPNYETCILNFSLNLMNVYAILADGGHIQISCNCFEPLQVRRGLLTMDPCVQSPASRITQLTRVTRMMTYPQGLILVVFPRL